MADTAQDKDAEPAQQSEAGAAAAKDERVKSRQADDLISDAMRAAQADTIDTGEASEGSTDIEASPEERVEALESERDELKDRLLRALADAENTRRRALRDRADAEKYGGVRLARDLLAVHDNLSRALKAVDEDVRERAKDLIEGVELTQRELLNAFSKHKIVPVRPEKGERFDVAKHQAMFEAPIPGAADGTVIEVMQDGFMYDDRLLRAAMVGVAKGGGAAEPDDSGQG